MLIVIISVTKCADKVLHIKRHRGRELCTVSLGAGLKKVGKERAGGNKKRNSYWVMPTLSEREMQRARVKKMLKEEDRSRVDEDK